MERFDYKILRMNYCGREGADFILNRTHGTDDYLFIQFKSHGKILIGDELTDFAPGDCIVYDKNMPHYFRPVGEELCHDWIHFLVDDDKKFRNCGIVFSALMHPTHFPYLSDIVSSMHSEHINRENGYEEMLSSYMHILLTTLVRDNDDKKRLSPYMRSVKDYFMKIRQDIYTDGFKNLNVCAIAASINLSRTRFAVLYSEFFGVSPKQDIERARLAYAKYLLKNTDYKLSYIAQACGYGGEFQLIRDFRKSVGKTPGEYRKS